MSDGVDFAHNHRVIGPIAKINVMKRSEKKRDQNIVNFGTIFTLNKLVNRPQLTLSIIRCYLFDFKKKNDNNVNKQRVEFNWNNNIDYILCSVLKPCPFRFEWFRFYWVLRILLHARENDVYRHSNAISMAMSSFKGDTLMVHEISF